jgi:1-acyl-sn-glycerol-3-phosphate acyltransferase
MSGFIDMTYSINPALCIASAIAFAALLLYYGRIELALMTFTPALVCVAVCLAIMVVIDVEFNAVSAVISTLIFSMVGSFGIFTVHGLLSEYKTGCRTFAARIHAYTMQYAVFRMLVTSQTKRGGFPYTLAGLANTIYAFTYFTVGCLMLQVIIVLLLLLPIGGKRKKLWFHCSVRFTTRLFLGTMFTTRRVAVNDTGETFSKPAVIIANHQSFIDILVLLSLHPKFVMVTKSWVWRSPFFGWIVRYADFYQTGDGYDGLTETLRAKVAEGYSVVVFPEGTRSEEMKLKRFHKGAFYLAQELNIDIVPIVLYGNGLVSSKSQPFYIKKGLLVSKILPRIAPADHFFGATYGERTKSIAAYFSREYRSVYEEYNRTLNPYFRDALIKSYVYKGPVLEWYMRIKVHIERNYDFFDRLTPREGFIVDIGCGYGALAYMLSMLSDRRSVTISVPSRLAASNCPIRLLSMLALSVKI